MLDLSLAAVTSRLSFNREGLRIRSNYRYGSKRSFTAHVDGTHDSTDTMHELERLRDEQPLERIPGFRHRLPLTAAGSAVACRTGCGLIRTRGKMQQLGPTTGPTRSHKFGGYLMHSSNPVIITKLSHNYLKSIIYFF